VPLADSAERPGVISPQANPSAARSGAVFVLALSLQRVLTLVLLPLFARFLTPTAYGQLSVAAAIATIATLGLSFGMDVATVLAWHRLARDPGRRLRWLSTIACFMTVVPIVACTIASCALLALATRLFGLPAWWLALALTGAALGVTATTVPLAVLRAQQRLRPFLILTCIIAAVNTLASLVFIAVFHWGVAGWLAGTLLGYACGLVVAIPMVPWNPAFHRATFDTRELSDALRFGLPLVPHLLSHWILQVADRTILIGIVAGIALGQYTLAVNLTIPIVVLATAMSQAAMPTFARAGQSDAAKVGLPRLTARFASIIAVVGLAAAALLPVLIANFLPAGYRGAAHLCGWLALGFTLAGLYQIPVNVITLLVGKTSWVWPITFLAGATDIGLVLVWCPTGGVRAAAIATAISYALLLGGFLLLALHLAGSRHFGFRVALLSCMPCLVAGYACSMLSERTVIGVLGRVTLVVVAVLVLARVNGIRARGVLLQPFTAGMARLVGVRRYCLGTTRTPRGLRRAAGALAVGSIRQLKERSGSPEPADAHRILGISALTRASLSEPRSE
jgi:O-antigen/teichoic acid export membrane protein